jgi:hypothetical protein
MRDKIDLSVCTDTEPFFEVEYTKIIRVLITNDKSTLYFETDGEPFAIIVYGDCCSQAWIEHVTGVEDCLGAKILEHKRYPQIDVYGSYQKYDVLYQSRFTLTKTDDEHYQHHLVEVPPPSPPQLGYLGLEYRCSSNGYYGASVDCTKMGNRRFEGIKNLPMRELTEGY